MQIDTKTTTKRSPVTTESLITHPCHLQLFWVSVSVWCFCFYTALLFSDVFMLSLFVSHEQEDQDKYRTSPELVFKYWQACCSIRSFTWSIFNSSSRRSHHHHAGRAQISLLLLLSLYWCNSHTLLLLCVCVCMCLHTHRRSYHIQYSNCYRRTNKHTHTVWLWPLQGDSRLNHH